MSEPVPPTDDDKQRYKQILGYLEAQSKTYTPSALRRALLRAGYRYDEIEAAFKRYQESDPAYKPLSQGWSFSVGMLIAIANAVMFPLVLISNLGRGIPWGIFAFILGLELGLTWLSQRGRSWTTGVALLFLLPIGFHLIFFGLCIFQ